MDVLAALDSLDKSEKRSRGGTNNKFVDPIKSSHSLRRPHSLETSSRPSTRGQQRPTTTQVHRVSITRPPHSEPTLLPSKNSSPSPSHLSIDQTERSGSITSTIRRVSFVEPPPPPSTRRRLRLTTKGASLLSGFEYDPTLATKYHVGEDEWNHFSDAIIKEARIPRRARYAWFFHKNDVMKRIKRDLQYNGDVSACISAWNRMDFRKKGFEVSLELPGPPKLTPSMSEEEKAVIKKQAPFFRLVLSPTTEKGQSIYVQSRSNSLTAGISGEGKTEAAIKPKVHDEHPEIIKETEKE
ncbi:BgTH12-05702 [Blumeria graminis f. sp. triticale]|uniref:BgTH12-05702 n=1 Tax=Blumeria graminis f. sp. triticale TaxID=1689686 RepID=A0A9W4GHJ7_BLUGR|nr:BgTH12-05702 [Blumeria graminis f. sp. triticale]